MSNGVKNQSLVRTLYLYLFSFVGLLILIIGCIRIVDLGLKMYVFKGAEEVVVYPEFPAAKTEMAEGTEELPPEKRAQYEEQQKAAQEKQKHAERQRTLAESLSMILVGSPLFLFHWRTIQKEQSLA